MIATTRAYEFSIVDSKIDSKINTIRQVSLISLGRAKGHETDDHKEVWVDGTTLQQVYECLTQMGTIKLKADHGSGVFSTSGWLDNFEKNGSQVLGELHFYENEPEKDRIFEIAKKNPTHLGLSLEFGGMEDEELGDKVYARCAEISAVALVSDPAANSSLFQNRKNNVDNVDRLGRQGGMANKITKLDAAESAGDPNAEMKKTFEDFCKRYDADQEANKADKAALSKRFDDFLNNDDGKAKIDGEGRNIEPNVTPVTVSDDEATKKDATKFEDTEKNEDKKDDDKKDDKVNKAAELASQKAIRLFAASLGITQIPAAGTGTGITAGASSQKNFSTLVADRAKELKGDKIKAMQECLKEFPEAYAEHRKSFMKVDKQTRTL